MKKILVVVMATVCAVMVAGCGDSVSLDKYAAEVKKNKELKKQISELDESRKGKEMAQEFATVTLDNTCKALPEGSSYIVLDNAIFFTTPIYGDITKEKTREAYDIAINAAKTLMSVHLLIEQKVYYFRYIAENSDLVFETKIDCTDCNGDVSKMKIYTCSAGSEYFEYFS